MKQVISSDLEFEWLGHHPLNMKGKCDLIHEGSCHLQFLIKLKTVCKVSLRYYWIFHFVPFLLKIRKCKNVEEFIGCCKKVIKEYSKSVLFMGFLVSLLKLALCYMSKAHMSLDGYFITLAGTLSGPSILFQQKLRRNEICYFVMAKALCSAYRMIKRLGYFTFGQQDQWMHIILMAFCYYIYCEQPQILKYRNFFSYFWGNDD